MNDSTDDYSVNENNETIIDETTNGDEVTFDEACIEFDEAVLEDSARPSLGKNTIAKGSLIGEYVNDEEYGGEFCSVVGLTYDTELGPMVFRCPVDGANRLQDLLGCRFNVVRRYGVVKDGTYYTDYNAIDRIVTSDGSFRIVLDANGIRMRTLAWVLLKRGIMMKRDGNESGMETFYKLVKVPAGTLDHCEVGIRIGDTGKEQPPVFSQKVVFAKQGLGNQLSNAARNRTASR